MPISLHSPGMRRAAVILFAVMLLPTLWLGLRTYRSFLLLRSAYEAGAPATSSIRGWMTLPYIAAAYHVPETALRQRLALPPAADPDANLKSLAERAGISPPQYVERVQRAVAAAISANAPAPAAEPSSWLASTSEAILTQLLVYGLPVLGLTLFLGAIGAPLPDGLATAVAGSLAGQGRMDWLSIIAVAVTASILGDVVGYAIGRLLGNEVLERHGYWIGYTSARRATVQALFDQWGMLTVFITRTFVSYLSSVASLLAGIAHYRLSRYLGVALVGRLIWTAAYLGLGYAVGSDLEAASGFLTNLSLLLVSAMVLAVSGLIAAGLPPQPRQSAT
jgi:membrane-associated protein